MNTKSTILFFSFLLLGVALSAQSWKKLSSQADALFEEGQYAEAAKLYEQAWQKKSKKKELIYKAGEAYYLMRDYPNSAKAYANVKADLDDFPLAGLYYARALKQEGNYDEAIREFRAYLDSYTGEERGILENIIRVEIEGAEIGKIAAANAPEDVELIHLGAGINTIENEFGPKPDAEGGLYYSSTVGGTARIFQSQMIGESWSKGELPSNFPLIDKGQFANACLSPDGQRLYFTICEEGEYGNLSTRCEIYYTSNTGGTWSQPVRLPDDINAPGVTSTHPFITQQNNTEYLFFSSNREDGAGRGGMDIWYSTRSLRNPGSNFSRPANLGPVINTNGDEITPYYRIEDRKLYFASNNHPSIGGFDIFVAEGANATWTPVVNMGLPYNSSADDYHYVENQKGGFFSSNRVVQGEKLRTVDDDLFQFINTAPSGSQYYSGTVLDVSNGEPINFYTVILYEITNDGPAIQVDNQAVQNGSEGFRFEVLASRDYQLRIDAPGFTPGTQNFNTYNGGNDIFAQAIMLEPFDPNPPSVDDLNNNTTISDNTSTTDGTAGNTTISEPVVDNTTTTDNTTPSNFNPPPVGEMYLTQGVGPYDKEEYRTNATQYEGTYYKIQVVALKRYNQSDSRYASLLDLGDIETEYLTQKGLYRVLLSAFLSASEAKSAQQTAQANGFNNAFVVKYIDGQRHGMVILR